MSTNPGPQTAERPELVEPVGDVPDPTLPFDPFSTAPIAEEIAYYLQHLPDWADHEGEHVLIKGSVAYGFHGSRNLALSEGLRRFGDVPFLVKEVILNERPRYLEGVIG